jgi:hypothetical protein
MFVQCPFLSFLTAFLFLGSPSGADGRLMTTFANDTDDPNDKGLA